MPDALLLYDGKCRFCRWSAAKVLALDRRRNLRPVDLHSAEADALFEGVNEEERFGSWHLVTRGERASAGAAFSPLFEALQWGRVPSKLLDRAPGLTERSYALVASRRSSLGSLVSEGADQRARERLGERS